MTIQAETCRICGSRSEPYAAGMVLDKYKVQYYSCGNCGFIQTESPYWLEEAYSSAIARSDIGLIGRNIKLASICSSLIPLFYDSRSSYLDYGGGNGMFVRMMRDKGYDFCWQDKYSVNQFAVGAEAVGDRKYSLVTAFEVLEHLPQPLEVIDEMMHYSDTLVFSTRLLPRWSIRPEEWWYFTPDTGQHVSLYSRESLEFIARKLNLHFSTNGVSLHIFSPRSVPEIFLKAISFYPFALMLSGLINLGRRSLLEEDYFRMTGRKLN